ncbi:hypothetical protein [Pandoraea sp. SD6-2]|uniref:hypothetical protein n=1 Tax=Pandoraea sp. SD6-2 TaxID=1286093 RepID=UPI00032F5D57|nr:hypothetical protein [Pandoraea sp. SD6-2]EON13151.1 hypothetical protein C266_14104 [Pandoraea sp. SD6-2]
MADLSDVSNLIVAQVAAYLYPNGTANPISPIVGCAVKVFPGWPQPEAMREDFASNIGYVSVYPLPTETVLRSTVREWELQSIAAPTVTVTVSDATVTLGGAVAAPQNVAAIVDGKPYVYGVQATDSLAGIATALATAISADRPATSAGPAFTVPGAHSLEARVGTTGRIIRELRRQRKGFQITAWGNCFDVRDRLGMAIDQAIGPLVRATLPDGSMAIFHYQSSRQDDAQQKQQIYRRDVIYGVDYSTTQIDNAFGVVAPQAFITGGVDALDIHIS